MSILKSKLTLEWFVAQDACNLPALREYFKRAETSEFDITPEGIMRAHRAGVLSSNWLARRILSGVRYAVREKLESVASIAVFGTLRNGKEFEKVGEGYRMTM